MRPGLGTHLKHSVRDALDGRSSCRAHVCPHNTIRKRHLTTTEYPDLPHRLSSTPLTLGNGPRTVSSGADHRSLQRSPPEHTPQPVGPTPRQRQHPQEPHRHPDSARRLHALSLSSAHDTAYAPTPTAAPSPITTLQTNGEATHRIPPLPAPSTPLALPSRSRTRLQSQSHHSHPPRSPPTAYPPPKPPNTHSRPAYTSDVCESRALGGLVAVSKRQAMVVPWIRQQESIRRM